MSDHTSSWWADGSVSRARRTTAAALAILLGLGGVSTFVWLSPEDSPPRSALGAVLGALDPTAELQQQHDALTAEHAATVEALGQETASAADLREQLAELELSLAAANDSLAAARAENGALSQQLEDTADADASGGTGGTSSGGSGGSSDGTGGSTGSDGSTGGSGGGSGSSGGTGGSGGSSGGSGGGTTPTTPELTAPPLADLVAPSSPYYGMYTAQAPFNWAVYDDVSSKLDARPDVVGYFSGWDEEFRTSAVERAWARDTLPIMTWESRPIGAANDVVDEPDYALPRILEGDFDAYLHQYAQDIVELGLPLGIRLNHEMNGTWYPWSESTSSGGSINGNNPGDYVKVWQHVHDIFEAEGANDLVMWIWAPNIINNLPTAHRTPEHLASLYPGDDYVDWVGLSGYLRPPYRSDQSFTFDYTFGPSLAQLRDLTDKPILLAEVGASETGGHKPAWVTSFFDGLADPANDDIVGFAWFNLAVTTYVQGERSTNDWRIDSRQDSLDAFREGLLDPANDFQLLPY